MKSSIISSKHIITYAEAYLLLPVVLWIYGWLQPWLAYPLMILLIVVFICHALRPHRPGPDLDDSPQAKQRPLFFNHLCIYAVLCAIAVFMIGFDGRVMQSYDLMVRGPLYDEVIRQVWPVQMPDGCYIRYALPFWLPAGLAASWEPSLATPFLQLWCTLGLLLICLVLHTRLGLGRTLLFYVVIFCISPLTGTVDDVLNTVFIKDAIMGVHLRVPSPLTQFFNTFHYFITTCLVLSLLMAHKLPLGKLILVTACFAVLHPMVAAQLIPFLCLLLYNDHCQQGGVMNLAKRIIKTPELYPCIVFVALALTFYFSSGGCWFGLTFFTPHGPAFNAFGISVCITGILLTMLLPLGVYWCNHDKNLIICACICPVLMLLWYGSYIGINEWMYKYSVLYGFVIAYALASASINRRFYTVVTFIALTSSIPFLREIKRKQLPEAAKAMFSVQEKNFRHEWKGTLYHPESNIYPPFTAESLHLQFLFKQHQR